MWHWMRKINEKRIIAVSFDEVYGVHCEIGCKLFLIFGCNIRVYDIFILKIWQTGIGSCWVIWPHIVGVGYSVELIETLICRKKLILHSQMPFAVCCCCISSLLKYLCNSKLIVGYSYG